MEPLKWIDAGLKLVEEAYNLFKDEKTKGREFVDPFLIVDADDAMDVMELREFTNEQVKIALDEIPSDPDYVVLAGESEVVDQRNQQRRKFFVAKLYVRKMPDAYVYSSSISDEVQFLPLKFIGTEPNIHLEFAIPEGEASNINAIPMEEDASSITKTAFLVGHMDENRLWFDFKNFIADVYCKVGLETSRKFDFIFELSKYGPATDSMQEDYTNVKHFFDHKFAPQYSHIHASIRQEKNSL